MILVVKVNILIFAFWLFHQYLGQLSVFSAQALF